MTSAFTRIGALGVVLAAGVLAAEAAQASPASYAQANQLAIKERKLLLIDFYAEW